MLLNDIDVHFFRYLPGRLETLAYNGGILTRLKNNPLMALAIPFFMAGEIFATISFIKTLKPDAIHAHWLIPQGLAAICARWLARKYIPIISTSHGGDLFGLSFGPLKKLLRWAIKHSDTVTVVSNAMQEHAHNLGAPINHMVVIPMGTDLSHTFTPPSDPKMRKTNQLLFAGRLVEKKGVPILLQAMHYLLAEFPELKLDIVGDGPDREHLEAQSKELGLNKYVSFHGTIDHTQLAGFFQSATITIVPSIKTTMGDQEGFGLVIVEALGCECPVVVSDLPAVHDIVINGKTGILFPPGDAKQLHQQLKDLLNNSNRRRMIGQEGRIYVSRFDEKTIGIRYNEIIKTLIKAQL